MSDGEMPVQTKRAIMLRLSAGYRPAVVCRELGVTPIDLTQARLWAKRLNADECDVDNDVEKTSDYIPTPQEIANASAMIRSGWTEAETLRRRDGVLPDDEWAPPVFTILHSKTGFISDIRRIG